MAERTLKSPGVQTIETLAFPPPAVTTGQTPVGIIGTAQKGLAFIPKTVSSQDEYVSNFGNPDVRRIAPYAALQTLLNKNALTYCRVLGAGANLTTTDIAKTLQTGQVVSAGFIVTGTQVGGDGRHQGAVQFLVARHAVATNEAFGIPMFSNNDTFPSATPLNVDLVRGMIMCASSSRIIVLDGNQSAVGAIATVNPDDVATVSNTYFKLVISSSLGTAFGSADGQPGLKIFTASLNPTDQNYYAKLLNTDPDQFADQGHVLYADFPVDNEVAVVSTIGIVSGSANKSSTGGDTNMAFRDMYGHFDTRYQTPKTPTFISQPFGATEYDLFSIEALDDGEYANSLYKISIANLRASVDPKYQYGTFTVLVRKFNDTDINMNILEQFNNCSLDPNAANYVGNVIGDRRYVYNFDAEIDTEQRILPVGKYDNKSKFIRVVMNDLVERGLVPPTALPFGFHGMALPKTNDLAVEDTGGTNAMASRLAGVVLAAPFLTSSYIPPIPYRFKVTKGTTATSGPAGNPSAGEVTNSSYFWGVKFERNTNPLDPNTTTEQNTLIANYTKFLGITKLDALLTGSNADNVNNNKFTLARVALGNTNLTDLTASINTHMREAAYFRNGKVDPNNYTIKDSLGSRLTFAALLAQTASIDFNRFNAFAKFTTILGGGFDGVNILGRAERRMNDRACSFDVGGGAEGTYLSPGLAVNVNGTGQQNNTVNSYIVATKIMTDNQVGNHNVLAIPGIREPFVTDFALKRVRDYGMAVFLMDIVQYDENGLRIYDDMTSVRPNVTKTAAAFDNRAIDNNYGAAYFPDVYMMDNTSKRQMRVPPTLAALSAIAFNDRVGFPWFAAAGFNRGSLDFVVNTNLRLNVDDRNRLQDSRINPIASFPRTGYVIFGQKTLQAAKSALDRVNVRRMLLEAKRIIVNVGNKIVFEQNTPQAQQKFVNESNLLLGAIQAAAGLESFKVIMDSTNNSQVDFDNYRANGKIVLIPTRTVEIIELNFIITNSGVLFTL